jgi:hypothetical protein
MASSSSIGNSLLQPHQALPLPMENPSPCCSLWCPLQGYLSSDNKAPPAEIVTRGADGKEEKKPNPALESWEATDQQVVSYLLSSLCKEILSQVKTCAIAAQAWATTEGLFGSQTRARTNLRVTLATTQKGNMLGR